MRSKSRSGVAIGGTASWYLVWDVASPGPDHTNLAVRLTQVSTVSAATIHQAIAAGQTARGILNPSDCERPRVFAPHGPAENPVSIPRKCNFLSGAAAGATPYPEEPLHIRLSG